MPVISVIVPIYNAEKYLEGCIQSVLNQTYRNFELILIDDGSQDNSYKICKQRTQGSLRKRISDSVVSFFIAAFPEEPSGGRFCRCIWKKQETNSLNLFQLTL